jgi:hypothetical protein
MMYVSTTGKGGFSKALDGPIKCRHRLGGLLKTYAKGINHEGTKTQRIETNEPLCLRAFVVDAVSSARLAL